MKIQKEQEAFERFKAKQTGVDYETLKKDLDDCEKRFPNNRYAGWNFKSDWELWQAATAQAMPEGFVLVTRELSYEDARKQADSMFSKVEHIARNEQRDLSDAEFETFKNRWLCARTKIIQFDWKTMVEAQEMK